MNSHQTTRGNVGHLLRSHLRWLAPWLSLAVLASIAPPARPQAATPASSASPYLLHLSDVHLNTNAQAVSYGQDTGMVLWGTTKAKLRSILEAPRPPALILFSGDLSAHYHCGPVNCYLPPGQRASHKANLRALLQDLRELVGPSGVPLFFVPGNNDALAGDYFSFADAEQRTALNLLPETRNPYPALNTASRCGKPPCRLADPHPKMGYYAARPIEGLRLIGLNTIIWGTSYWPVDGINQVDAGNTQMLWLAQQLREAAAAGEQVYVLMHIPPGTDAYATFKGAANPQMWASLPAPGMTWQDQFLGLINHYTPRVAGLFYGHTHMDELRLLYDRTGTQVRQVAISSPGITPLDANNPGFKLVFFDPKSKEPTDFLTHYTTPNASRWGEASYRFSTTYGCAPSTTIRSCLADQTLEQISTKMAAIFTVKNCNDTGNSCPPYPLKPGIPVTFNP